MGFFLVAQMCLVRLSTGRINCAQCLLLVWDQGFFCNNCIFFLKGIIPNQMMNQALLIREPFSISHYTSNSQSQYNQISHKSLYQNNTKKAKFGKRKRLLMIQIIRANLNPPRPPPPQHTQHNIRNLKLLIWLYLNLLSHLLCYFAAPILLFTFNHTIWIILLSIKIVLIILNNS